MKVFRQENNSVYCTYQNSLYNVYDKRCPVIEASSVTLREFQSDILSNFRFKYVLS